MAARSVKIKLHNLTGFRLTKLEEGLDHGEWTGHVPEIIEPNSMVEFGSESGGDIPVLGSIGTGTEGHIKYKIEDGKNTECYFHWNNPFSSSAIGDHFNIFHEFINEGYAIYHTGDDNSHDEIVDLYIDISKEVTVPRFLPSTHGFRFANHWADFGYQIPALQDIPLIGDIKFGDASNGLCGGMVNAVRDYYEANYPIPQIQTVPNNPNDPLTKYIIDRLLASFDLRDVTMYLKLMSPAYADTDEGLLHQAGQQGRAYITIKEEWPMIKNDIDNGHPSPIGLIRIKSLNPGDLGHNHQVLVYGYKISGNNVVLRIYDPNYPARDNLEINLSLFSTAEPVKAVYNTNDGKPIYALFRTNYERRDGFPRFNYDRFISRFAATNIYASQAGKVYGTILLKKEAADWRDIRASDLGNPQTSDERFRAVSTYAVNNGYIGAFPNFFEADYGQGTVYGTLLIKKETADWKDIPAADLGNPQTPDERFRAVNTYASNNGYIGAFPNFFEADYGQGTVYGTLLIKKEAADWSDILASTLGIPQTFEERFRAVNTYAGNKGYAGAFPNFFEANYEYIGAFPNFFEADYGHGTVYGTLFIKKGAADWSDIPAVDLGNPQLPEERFRAMNTYAGKKGYIGAFPNFLEADYGQGTVYGTLLIKKEAADWKDIPAADLGNPQTPDERFRAVNTYASNNGYIGAFPNFFEADYGQGTVYGTLLIKKEAADWRDIPAADLKLQ
ncbi:aegerolysin family protein [Niabella drilacis]|uniref:Aegerolysin n=1 Tax=Niabella drilacis (strain DSM 25811 / CCM 8410 / CCUG 62505 / LMG 26954 / E90) TaxID=1285928 RepID=A0A1G6TFZ5_NIADE|nr:aegerolysin family protein [Niabella drilacis]SDD27446.1 Aegerolysin [Niabella drilacis]